MKIKDIRLKDYFNILFLAMVCLSVFLLGKPIESVLMQANSAFSKDSKNITIVIDPGHGGWDPGKVGINGALEKDINLEIALKLKGFLELNDIQVIMIREEDKGLYSESDSNKKAADMRKRVEIINGSNADLAISIHQNSFTQTNEKGAQVFYYEKSDEGKEYARIMQKQLKKSLNDGNRRVEKSNDSYYLLKKTECPLIIVECGFLSNYEEAGNLLDAKYQEKMAWSIHLGVLTYINENLNK